MHANPPRNRLLTLLPPAEFDRLAPSLTQVAIHQHDVLQPQGRSLSFVWLSDTAIASWLAPDGEGRLVEVATIGIEGMVGLSLFLDHGTTFGQLICQVSGSGWRMPASVFREESQRPGSFRDILSRYTQAVMAQMAQTAVCNRVHEITERCARWLLLTHDRVEGDQFTLTHEFLATMLGVRRASVTVAAGTLSQAGLIRYRRGHVEILDRAGLEDEAWPCYLIVRSMFERVIGSSTG